MHMSKFFSCALTYVPPSAVFRAIHRVKSYGVWLSLTSVVLFSL